MDSFPVPLDLRCVKCGCLALVVEPELAEQSAVTCASCGAQIGRWGEIKQQALQASSAELRKRVKHIFWDEPKAS
jgi:hypothetical protein